MTHAYFVSFFVSMKSWLWIYEKIGKYVNIEVPLKVPNSFPYNGIPDAIRHSKIKYRVSSIYVHSFASQILKAEHCLLCPSERNTSLYTSESSCELSKQHPHSKTHNVNL